ncbi:MAG: response regulator, partial [Bacteroidota bacterium]
MLKAIVVDDEQQGRETIIGVIDNFCEDVAVTGSAASVDEAYTLIRQAPPDVLFLDVEMGTQSGFNLLEQLGEVGFEVIFVTAYDQYAIKAIKFCAIEYLLKPIDLDELKRAIEKVRENLELKSFKRNFQALLGNLRNSRPEEHKIAI